MGLSFLGPALTRLICVNSEIGERLICEDIAQTGKMPMFLWRKKPTPKSIGPAAEYIDFDRQTRSFSFNSEKMEKNKSIAVFEEDGLGWSVFKRILMIIVITGLDCLWLYFTAYPLLIFFIENMPFKQFSIFI